MSTLESTLFHPPLPNLVADKLEEFSESFLVLMAQMLKFFSAENVALRGSVTTFMRLFFNALLNENVQTIDKQKTWEVHQDVAYILKALYFRYRIDERSLNPVAFALLHAILQSHGYNMEFIVDATLEDVIVALKTMSFSVPTMNSTRTFFVMHFGYKSGGFNYIAVPLQTNQTQGRISPTNHGMTDTFSGMVHIFPTSQPGFNPKSWDTQNTRRPTEVIKLEELAESLKEGRFHYTDVELRSNFDSNTGFWRLLHLFSRFIRSATFIPSSHVDAQAFKKLAFAKKETTPDIMNIIGIMANLFPVFLYDESAVRRWLTTFGLDGQFPYLNNPKQLEIDLEPFKGSILQIFPFYLLRHYGEEAVLDSSIYGLFRFLPITIGELAKLSFTPALVDSPTIKPSWSPG